ncbi:SPOR domain-containing protein [Novosphingobium sp.]|uniref:SPOR domain-containing protein n=1 Tax=Novosphingobium sp. TaxID=1874826 RepID=UPI0028AA7B4B|nr:SPOR domain-containing protein [Novosphingobium sp.]
MIANKPLRHAGLALCTAMGAVLLVSCAGQAPFARSGAPASSVGVVEKDILRAEQRVARSPRDASARAALAQGYLAAGRFDSAATTFEDAISLGDQSPRTGLSTALAYIGAGREAEAMAVLRRFQNRIPGSDYGLAVALAGSAAVGVDILTNVVRGGENTPKARQNLAYAYALDGRWREARLIASQDVPADQLDARLSDWASAARPDQSRARIAGLIGAPLRSDPGQPIMLALNPAPVVPQMAKAETRAPAAEAELPPVQTGESFWGVNQPQDEQPVPPPASVRKAAVLPLPKPALPRPSLSKAASAPRTQAPSSKGISGTHLVQLGAFRTIDGAKKAWGIFQSRNPALKGHDLRISEAKVNGQTYYRVAAGGFDQRTAQSVCSALKQGGNPCFAYAQQRPLPGGVRMSQARRAEL